MPRVVRKPATSSALPFVKRCGSGDMESSHNGLHELQCNRVDSLCTFKLVELAGLHAWGLAEGSSEWRALPTRQTEIEPLPVKQRL